MKKIGIDPSLNQTGWAVADNGKIIASGIIKPQGQDYSERLWNLYGGILYLMSKYKPDSAIIEIQDKFGSYIKRQNKWTGKGLNQDALNKQNWAIGVVIAALHEYLKDSQKIEMVTTTQWKGRLNKNTAKACASNIVKKEIKNDNEAEAILLASIQRQYIKKQQKTKEVDVSDRY